jgi:hypothetical protein
LKVIDILLAVIRYSFLFFLILFVYLIYKMMFKEISLLRGNKERVELNSLLLYVLDPGEGESLDVDTVLPIHGLTTIGRDSSNDIVINDPHVSSQHARLELTGGDLYLIDLNSTNGSYVNGRKIKGKEKIFLGDEIIIGDVSFEVAGWENESSCTN